MENSAGEGTRATQSVSIFFVGAGFVDGNAPEVFGHLDEPLVAVVPLGARLVQEHASLKGPAELHETRFADVGAEPARVFEIFVVGVLGVGEAGDQTFEV